MSQPNPNPNLKTEGKVEGKTEGKIEGKTHIEGKVEGKVEGKTNIQGKVEGKTEGKVEGKTEGKVEGKVEGKTNIEGKVEGKYIINTNPESSPYQLPTTVNPLVYNLHLIPNFVSFTFKGELTIELEVKQRTNQIQFNAKNLELDNISLELTEGKLSQNLPIQSRVHDPRTNIVTLTLGTFLEQGSHCNLVINYEGAINDKLAGFYRSSVPKHPDQKYNWMFSTHFEPSESRQAFPGWDEPKFRSKFNIKITIPKDLTALSNMPETSTTDINNELKLVTFDTTPKMPTYLVAFAVGEFDFVESQMQKIDGTTIPVRVYTPLGFGNQGKFGVEVTKNALMLYEKVFKTPYQLPKVDSLAVTDFNMGAMENWGLITYRSEALLFDPEKSTPSIRQRIAGVIAHELAHQWFGNLVTLDWWSQLWLKEGFATWLGTYCVDKLFPQWDIWTDFVVDDNRRALNLDSLASSHPIEVVVNLPEDIGQIFDAISYSKGASVIHMLYGYLGEETFFQGLRLYLDRYAYGSAKTKDLWRCFEEAGGAGVGEMMGVWTRVQGYPVVKVEEQDGQICVCQNRYLSGNEHTLSEKEKNQTWWVPLGLVKKDGSQFSGTQVVTKAKQTIEVSLNEVGKFNKDTTGLYLTHYPSSHIKQLGEQLLNSGDNHWLTDKDKIGLLGEVGTLTKSGAVSTVDLLDFLTKFSSQASYYVLEDWVQWVGLTNLVFASSISGLKEHFSQLKWKIFSNLVDKLGWDTKPQDADLTGYLRALSIYQCGDSGYQPVVEEGKRRFAKLMEGDESAVSPGLRSAVYNMAIKFGGEEEYQLLKRKYLETDVEDQKLICLRSLCATTQPHLIEATLAWALTDEVRSKDLGSLIAVMSRNPLGGPIVWKFVQTNWGKILQLYGDTQGTLGNIVKSSFHWMSQKSQVDEVQKFFNQNEIKGAKRGLEQGLENVQLQCQWLERDLSNVKQWLDLNLTQ